MSTKVRSTTSILMVILVVLSAMGWMVAGQQYFLLQGQKEMKLIRREQDESFLIVMKAVGGESNPEMDKALALQKVIIKGADSSAEGIIRQLEIRAIADFITWCVIFVISGVTLFLNHRKQTSRPSV